MARFTQTKPAAPSGVIGTIADVQTSTAQGGTGFVKDSRSELFQLAVMNFVGQDTFYESAGGRDSRFVALIREVTALDPDWMAEFIPWLRNGANMRTASIIAAVEYARALPNGGRSTVDAALQRADEPAEAVGYWLATYGRVQIPKAIKRGIADAAVRLYNERAALKWDSREANVRMGDVIELTHPKPKAPWQHALFTYLIDVRHGRKDPRGLDQLPTIAETKAAHQAAADGEGVTVTKGMTWEQRSAHGPMNAAAWSEQIPTMGYMALLRNLRNFEEQGVAPEVLDQVAARLQDPDAVAKSRQMPFRFWTAFKHSGTMRFGPALERALDLSLANIPEFSGRTLVMVDTSGSMENGMSGKSEMTRVEAAALFGAAAYRRSADGSMIAVYAQSVAPIEIPSKVSVLRATQDLTASIGAVGHATYTWESTQAMWNQFGPFDRILVFTDEQDGGYRPGYGTSRYSNVDPNSFVPADVPIYVWDLAGYQTANLATKPGRYQLAGLADASFNMIDVLERSGRGRWPWDG